MAEDSAVRKRKRSATDAYQIVTLQQWLGGWGGCSGCGGGDADGESTATLPIVDLRSGDDFDRRHLSLEGAGDELKDVAVVNLPLPSLLSGDRSSELPPRHVPFAILVPRQRARSFVDDDEGCPIHELFFSRVSERTSQSRKPWLVRQVLLDGDDLWSEATECKLVRSVGEEGLGGGDRTDSFPFRCLPRLWKSDPLISSDILPLLKEWVVAKSSEAVEDGEGRCRDGLVLDLGSGAGRDICFLAEELKQFRHSMSQTHPSRRTRSVRFVGIDNHKGSARRCAPLWRNRGVEDVAGSALLDLNKLHRVREYFVDSTAAQRGTAAASRADIVCIYAIRFLNRKLLAYIANSLAVDGGASAATGDEVAVAHKNAMHLPPPPLILPTGTVVAVSHFCKPREGARWDFDHPSESSVLERWELRGLFGEGARKDGSNSGSKARWQILKDELVSDGDHGRTLIQFLARKVA